MAECLVQQNDLVNFRRGHFLPSFLMIKENLKRENFLNSKGLRTIFLPPLRSGFTGTDSEIAE